MTDPILLLLTRLRDLYLVDYARVSGATIVIIDPVCRLKHIQVLKEAISELDLQIARCVEEERREPLHDDISLYKRDLERRGAR